MSGCTLYGERAASWLLKDVIESASAAAAGREFHSGMVWKMVEFQRVEDLVQALGLYNLWVLVCCPQAGHFERTKLTGRPDGYVPIEDFVKLGKALVVAPVHQRLPLEVA